MSGPASKRPRQERDSRSEKGFNNSPSRVLYLSNLPKNCSENDLGNIMGQYGPIVCVQLMRGGREALVEYADMKCANEIIRTANKKTFNIGPNVVRLEYSNSQSIRRRDSALSSGGGMMGSAMTMMDQQMLQRQQEMNVSMGGIERSRILHLDISDVQYPINVEVIHTICSLNGREGSVDRICIGKLKPDDSIEALVEFSSIADAQKVIEQLDGADIYSGCCTLHISYSKLNRVMVVRNDEESWDFTSSNPGRHGLLGSQPAGGPMMGRSGSRMVGSNSMGIMQQQMAMQSPGNQGGMSRRGMSQSNMFQDQMMSRGMSIMGGIGSGHMTGNSSMGMRMGMGMRGRGMGMDDDRMDNGMMAGDADGFVPFETGEGVVVMFYNLDERTNCDHLFNLCCLYGNVARIKFLKSRPDCAMVQMGNRMATSLVIQHYNGVRLFGKKIEVSRSKQVEIVEQSKPLKLPDGTDSNRNFMNDMNNRFRNAYLASQCKIVAPSNTVHFFNAPRHFTSEEMTELFEKENAPRPMKVAVFPIKENAKTSLGLVEWESLDEAVDAMAICNHTEVFLDKVSHPYHLKLTYSTRSIRDSDYEENGERRGRRPPKRKMK